MSDNIPLSLDAQVIARVRQFLQSTGITQRELCRMISEKDPANFNSFLSGSKGLSVNKMHRLLQVLSLNSRQLEAKLASRKVHIEHFQSADGKSLTLDNAGASVPGQSGEDPDGSTDISGTGTARDQDSATDYIDEIHDFLRDQQEVHRSAISAIDDYFNTMKAKVNKGPTTEGVRRTTDNSDSSCPGSRGDKFKVTPAQRLAYLQKDRERAEAALAIQLAINEERKKRMKAYSELQTAEKQTTL